MKAILMLFTILLFQSGFGQPKDTVATKEYLTLYADGKTYHFTQLRASYKEHNLFIQGNKPTADNMFPIFQLFVQPRERQQEYNSKTDKNSPYGTLRKGGQEMYSSQSHNGSCTVSLHELTETHVKGSFSMTAYNQYGSSAMLLTGTFFLKLKKE